MSKDSENENERLAREWMASEHWGGWRVGMVDGLLGSVVENAGDAVSWGRRRVWGRDPAEGVFPDLDHPGTRAFLLEDVRMAWASEGVFYLEYIAEGRRRHLGCLDSEDGPANLVGDITETGTLMAALRAAPEKTK